MTLWNFLSSSVSGRYLLGLTIVVHLLIAFSKYFSQKSIIPMRKNIIPVRHATSCFAKPFPTFRSRLDFATILQNEDFTVGAELGAQGCVFAKHNLNLWTKAKEYVLIDEWKQHNNNTNGIRMGDSYYEESIKRLDVYKEKIRICRDRFIACVKDFPDGYFDFIYISKQEYFEVKQDMEIWWPKLKEGGIMAGHDYVDTDEVWHLMNKNWSGHFDSSFYAENYTIEHAVDDFADRNNLQVVISDRIGPGSSWAIRKPICRLDFDRTNTDTTARISLPNGNPDSNCILLLTFNGRIIDDPNVFDSNQCQFYEIALESLRNLTSHSDRAAGRGTKFVVLKAATDLLYVRRYSPTLVNAALYCAMHNCKACLFFQNDTKVDGHFSKVDGSIAILKIGVPVLFLDLDAWFNLKLNFSAYEIIKRHKPPIIIQGETNICSCVFIVKPSLVALRFLQEWRSMGSTSCCSQHTYDQIAFKELLIRKLGIDVAKRNRTYYLSGKEPADSRSIFPSEEALTSSSISFIDQRDPVNLHNCLGGWGGCIPRSATSLIYHTGSLLFEKFRTVIKEESFDVLAQYLASQIKSSQGAEPQY